MKELGENGCKVWWWQYETESGCKAQGGMMRKVKIFILLCCAVCAGCASSAVTTLHDETVAVSMVGSVAGMPFVKARRCEEALSGESTVLDCRLSSLKSFPEFYSPGAVQEISSALHEELEKKYGAALEGYEASAAVFKALSLEQPDSTLRSLATAFARKRGVEYIFIGVLQHYIDRKGSAGGVTSPASVSFSLYLVRASTGSVVFEGSYDETQQALLENILNARVFFRRGARWLTAEELAREGIESILDEMK